LAREFWTPLECGCLVSCEGGGGLFGCDDEQKCKFKEYADRHRPCTICRECIICFDHTRCKEVED